MTSPGPPDSVDLMTSAIQDLSRSVDRFRDRAEEIEKGEKRRNLINTLLLVLLLVAVGVVGYIGVQARNLSQDLQSTSATVNDISGSPQGGAVGNRKFIFLVAQCQETTTTLAELDACVGDHYKSQYKCGQDVNDDRICVPLVVKED